MILPAYSLSAGIDSVLVTMHVPRFVSIGSPGCGECGQLDVVDILEARRLDGDDVALHSADSPCAQAALQHPNGV